MLEVWRAGEGVQMMTSGQRVSTAKQSKKGVGEEGLERKGRSYLFLASF
jgi:hypothetical protein